MFPNCIIVDIDQLIDQIAFTAMYCFCLRFSSLAGLIVMGYFQRTCNYSKMFPSNAIRHALFFKIPTDRVTRELVTSFFLFV